MKYPDEILLMILSFIPQNKLIYTRLVCLKWKNIIREICMRIDVDIDTCIRDHLYITFAKFFTAPIIDLPDKMYMAGKANNYQFINQMNIVIEKSGENLLNGTYKRGMTTFHTSNVYEQALMGAYENGNIKFIEFVEGYNGKRYINENRLLYAACEGRSLEAIQRLFKIAQKNNISLDYFSSLWIAIEKDYLDLAKLLMQVPKHKFPLLPYDVKRLCDACERQGKISMFKLIQIYGPIHI